MKQLAITVVIFCCQRLLQETINTISQTPDNNIDNNIYCFQKSQKTPGVLKLCIIKKCHFKKTKYLTLSSCQKKLCFTIVPSMKFIEQLYSSHCLPVKKHNMHFCVNSSTNIFWSNSYRSISSMVNQYNFISEGLYYKRIFSVFLKLFNGIHRCTMDLLSIFIFIIVLEKFAITQLPIIFFTRVSDMYQYNIHNMGIVIETS